jgi:hypothetical protein
VVATAVAAAAVTAVYFTSREPPPQSSTAKWCGREAVLHCSSQSAAEYAECERANCDPLCRPGGPADLCNGCLQRIRGCRERVLAKYADCGACPPGTSCMRDLNEPYTYCCGQPQMPCGGTCMSTDCASPREFFDVWSCRCQCQEPWVRASSGACVCPPTTCPPGAPLLQADCTCAPCPTGLTDCGGHCVSLSTDPFNCGSCGNACGFSEECCSGTCSSLDSDTQCGNCSTNCLMGRNGPRSCCPIRRPPVLGAAYECVDLQTDPENCGTCQSLCNLSGGKVCAGGRCECPANSSPCGSAVCCHFPKTICVPGRSGSPDTCSCAPNLHECGNDCCAPSWHCSHGHCCPGGEDWCGGKCLTCPPKKECVGGQCVCMAGYSVCPDGSCCTPGYICAASPWLAASPYSCCDPVTPYAKQVPTSWNPRGLICCQTATGVAFPVPSSALGAGCCDPPFVAAANPNNPNDPLCVCPPGRPACSSAEPCCPQGKDCCGGHCFDLQTDRSHCGSCTNACPLNLVCVGGQCVCPSGTDPCNGGCIPHGMVCCPPGTSVPPGVRWCSPFFPVCCPPNAVRPAPPGYCCAQSTPGHECCYSGNGCC